jgi:hypothetical protein
LLGNFSFSYDSDVSIATALVEGIVLHFPNTQDSLNFMNTTNMAPGCEGSKSVTYMATPQTVLDSNSDGPQCLDSNVLSKSAEAIAATTTMPRSTSFWKKLKELHEGRFTHPQRIKPTYAWGGR